MDPNKTDPVIIDLLNWLRENLPPEAEDEALFKNVRRVQKVFDRLMSFVVEEYLSEALKIDENQNPSSLEDVVTRRLEEMREYIALNEDKKMKNKKLDVSRAKLNLKKEQYKLITSVRLDGCMDLISRYNHLMSKK